MSSARRLLTTLATMLVMGFLIAMLLVLRIVGQDLRRVEEAHRDTSLGLGRLDKAAEQLRVGLEGAEEAQARLAEEAADFLKAGTDEKLVMATEWEVPFEVPVDNLHEMVRLCRPED